VYLLYVDESGRPLGRTGHFVVAGLAIHEEDCYPLAKQLRSTQRRIVGAVNADLELHASDIWAGRKVWAHVQQVDRLRLINSVFAQLGAWRAPSGREPRYFGVVVHKPSFPKERIERAHEELFARFDEFVGRLHMGGDSHRSIVVADDSSYETLVQTLVPRWKAGVASRLGPLHSLVEVPLYVSSEASRLVQVADFVAWAISNYYENGHSRHLQKLHRRFDADGGIQHGLVHLRRAYQYCICIPCESRRTQVIRDVLPILP
jgi:Protein of unknown function (DUF3800)